MEIFGGFMVMMSILGLFLAVVWLIMPFVVFAMKGRQDRSLEVLEGIDRRLAAMEQQLDALRQVPAPRTEPPAAAGEDADRTAQPTDLPLACTGSSDIKTHE